MVSVGGTHNVLVQYVVDGAPNPSDVILCNPFKWDILLFSSDQKSYIVCVPAVTVNRILCRNHRYRKVVGGTHNVLVHYMDDSAPSPSDVVLCNPFKWDILLFSSDQKSYNLCACSSARSLVFEYMLPMSINMYIRLGSIDWHHHE